jgi:hypothetical protein
MPFRAFRSSWSTFDGRRWRYAETADGRFIIEEVEMPRWDEVEPRMPSSDPVELAWAAGFFDGEGSVFVNRQKRVPHRTRANPALYDITSPNASVAQVELAPLERFAKAVGGRAPSGPYKTRNVNANLYYRWDACGRPSVHRMLVLLWPYLCAPKRAQAHAVWAELERLKRPKSPPLPPLPGLI